VLLKYGQENSVKPLTVVNRKDYKAKMFQRRGGGGVGAREICRWFGIFPMEEIDREQQVYI
jgi:hypothetical protein